MSVAVAGEKPAVFEIKSANLPLVALLLKSTDLQAVADTLASRYGDLPDFFDNDPLVIDLSPLPADATAPDFAELVALLRRYRVAPVAVRGGSEALMAAALAGGLVAANDALPIAAPAAPPTTRAPAPVVTPPPVVSPSALVLDRPLRSGQQFYAKGRDLVVLAMVNPGAEVIADGHIHVYAPLRGKAMAGARGHTEARIFSLSLEPELLSIAGIYRTSETPLPDGVWGQPTQVRLHSGADGDKLVFEALKA